jgi:hypothetical protein
MGNLEPTDNMFKWLTNGLLVESSGHSNQQITFLPNPGMHF